MERDWLELRRVLHYVRDGRVPPSSLALRTAYAVARGFLSFDQEATTIELTDEGRREIDSLDALFAYERVH